MQLRVALTTSDYERLVRFYCAGLGLEPAQLWTSDQGHGLVLDMGTATLEIFDENYALNVDQIEAGKRVSGQVRFALQVPDLESSYGPVARTWGNSGSPAHYYTLGGS